MSITEIDVLDEIEIEDAPVSALSPTLQSIARNYIGARSRAGGAILDAARYLAEARAAAKRGEWSVFLESTGTQEDTATRMLAIARRAADDQQYARAISDGRLALTAAFEILSAPAETQQRAIESDTPTPISTIRAEKQAAKLRNVAEFAPAPDLPTGSDAKHQQAIDAILRQPLTSASAQQAYDHAREIHAVDLYNKMIALIDRATDEPAPESPAPAADNAASYDAKAARDSDRLERAHSLIAIGQHATARALLDQVEVSTYARDQLLATIPAGRSVTLTLSAHDCAALRKEAKAFEKIGLPTKLPTIARALTLLIEGMAQ
jgi:hypothetical protein